MKARHYIACDLGAESGRVMLGTLDAGKLTLEEMHRFPTGPVVIAGTWRWDVLRLFEELSTGIRKVVARGVPVASLSTDTWGVDYVWLKGNEPLLTVPFHYRDARTDGGFERASAVVPLDTIFAETGIQFMTLNMLYQLHDDQQRRPWVFQTADRFLNIADYFNYLFSGVAKAEASLASTTQLYNPRQRTWSKKLLQAFQFPEKVFPEVVPAGTVLGPALNVPGAQVVASCSHDTGAAVAAVPAVGTGWAYLSSGTWSLIGSEVAEPVINDRSRQYNFTNEVGYGNSIRLLKNISGLWLVQECRRHWGKHDYVELRQLAEKSAPLRSLINPNDARFSKAGDMPEKIAAFCRATQQPVPTTPGEITRCILESLALLYRRTLDQLEAITGQRVMKLHIVGGGSQNLLLNQFSANATGLPVIAGPVEATAIGNLLIQAIALGDLPDLVALRQVVRQSFPVTEYAPQDAAAWQAAARRFAQLLGP